MKFVIANRIFIIAFVVALLGFSLVSAEKSDYWAGNSKYIYPSDVKFSVGVGDKSSATGAGSLAVGALSNASGDFSLAVGFGATTVGQYSTALGGLSYAGAIGSLASGWGSKVYETGAYAAAMGYNAFAAGSPSFALGSFVNAEGSPSFSIGRNLNASAPGSFVFGVGPGQSRRLTNNVPNSFIVGFGATPIFFANGTSVGIGTTTPVATLDVNGAVRLAPLTTTPVCTASTEGVLYYDKTKKIHYGCNGVQWNALYELKPVVTQTPRSNTSVPRPVASTLGADPARQQPVVPPSTALQAVPFAAGLLKGSYKYIVTFVNAQGMESSYGPVSQSYTTGGVSMSFMLKEVPIGSSNVVARKIYRTSGTDSSKWYYLATVNNNQETEYLDIVSDELLTDNDPVLVASPPVSSLKAMPFAAGMLKGTYYYKLSYVYKGVESALGPTSSAISTGGVTMSLRLYDFPLISNGVDAIKIYRTSGTDATTFYPVVMIRQNLTNKNLEYIDITPDNQIVD